MIHLFLLPSLLALQDADAEKALRASAAKVAGLAKSVTGSSDPKTLDAAFEDFAKRYQAPGLSDEVRASVKAELVPVLQAGRARVVKAALARSTGSAGWKSLTQMRAELDRRREAALKLIGDESVYLREDHADWPKGPKANGQDKVDALVLKKHRGSVEELWVQGSALAVKIDPALAKELALVRRFGDAYLHEFGEDPDDADLKPLDPVLLNLPGPVTLRGLVLTEEERDRRDWNRAVDRWNDGLKDPGVGKEEKEHTRIVNDYREMMGVRRLWIDARLCRAAKKHSAVCDAAGRIWHDGTDGTPDSRVKGEGFPGSAGENVALGSSSPVEIWWKGWYEASDHHRNALRASYTCFGYGYSGRVGTQNLGEIAPPEGLLPSR